MASSKKSSTKSRSTAKAATAKPTVAKGLHKSARKQLASVAKGGAGQEKAGKSKAAPTPRVSPPKPKSKAGGVLKRAGQAVRTAAKKVTSAVKQGARKKAPAAVSAGKAKSPAAPSTTRTTRRVSNVDVTKLDFMSGQASSKSPFATNRSDAFAKQDIESALIDGNAEWDDEDHFTNKTGNKRIGTKGRKYE